MGLGWELCVFIGYYCFLLVIMGFKFRLGFLMVIMGYNRPFWVFSGNYVLSIVVFFAIMGCYRPFFSFFFFMDLNSVTVTDLPLSLITLKYIYNFA